MRADENETFEGGDSDGEGSKCCRVVGGKDDNPDDAFDPVPGKLFPLFAEAELKAFVCWIVDERLASKAASASGDSVCEKDRGGYGTPPGAGGTARGG